MILIVSLLTLLVATSTEGAIKGGRRIFQEPSIQGPHIHVGKGGGGGALHHTAVVQDPLSGAPVVVEKVSRVGSGGIKSAGLGGIKSAGLGAGSAQFALSDGPFGQRRLYRVGQSQIPFGLLGSDYYSYPASLLTAPRGFGKKSVLSNNLSGLRPVGFGGRSGGIIVADPSTSQFSVGDSQIKTSVFGARRPIYRSGISSVPYGLMGLDYYSYPNQLLTQRQLSDDLGFGQTRILTGGSAFSAGDSQITQQVIPQQVAVVEDGFGQRQVIKTTGGGLGGIKGGQFILSGGRRFGGLVRGFGQRQVAVTKSAPASVFAGPSQIISTAGPLSQIKTDVGLQRSYFGNRVPQLIYVDGGRRFPGIDIIGGSRIGDPRLGYTQLPISTSRFANLGLLSSVGKTNLVSSKIGGIAGGGALGLTAVGHTSPTKVVTQEEVVGPLGDRQVVTTVTETDSNRLVGSKVGGLASGGLKGIGRSAPTQIVTQEEVVGPAGDPQVITTVTQTDSVGPSKIGGFASGGLAGIGQGPATIVQQEEVVSPISGLRTTSQISQVVQDPIETAIQETLGDGGFSQTVQSLVDPLSGGQVSIDDGLGGGVTQVKETLVREPFTGEVTKVTEVTKSGGSGGALAQQNIADTIVQESISSGLGGSGGYGYLPRMSLLSQYPYDAPDMGLLRSVVTRPVVQQQQEVGQFLLR